MSVIARALSRSGHALLRSRLGLVVVLAAAIVGTTTVGFAGAITTGLIYACVNNSSGTIKVVSATATCSSNEILLVWNSEGSQGPAGPTGPTGPTGPSGTFSGTFTSPNGQCSIQVTDTGITLGTPSCPLVIEVLSTSLRSSGSTSLLSGASTTLQSSAHTAVSSGGITTITGGVTVVDGSIVTLGGVSGCRPVARMGDVATVNPATDTATIVSGSVRVMAC